MEEEEGTCGDSFGTTGECRRRMEIIRKEIRRVEDVRRLEEACCVSGMDILEGDTTTDNC